MNPVAYTLVLHYYGSKNDQNHLDLFLDTGEERLLHYQSPLPLWRKNKSMTLGTPHRRIYLDFQGEISGGRGRVRIVRKGLAQLDTGQPPLEQIKVSFDGQGLLTMSKVYHQSQQIR